MQNDFIKVLLHVWCGLLTFGDIDRIISLRNRNLPSSWWNLLPQFFTQASSNCTTDTHTYTICTCTVQCFIQRPEIPTPNSVIPRQALLTLYYIYMHIHCTLYMYICTVSPVRMFVRSSCGVITCTCITEKANCDDIHYISLCTNSYSECNIHNLTTCVMYMYNVSN